MARNFFGQGGRRQPRRSRQDADQLAREQQQRRMQQQEQQRAALRGDDDPYLEDDEFEDYIEESDEGDDIVVAPSESPNAARPETYRQSDDRRREDATVSGLQQQIDELRLLVKDLTDQRSTDQAMIKRQEVDISRLQRTLEEATREANQASEAASLNEARTRQYVDELEERLEDNVRPIRSLQGHVTDLLEQNRRRTDDTNQNKERFGELATSIESLTAMSDRTSAVAHGLRDNIDQVRSEMDEIRRDIIRTDDSVKIVDQDARRRTATVSEGIDGFTGRIDEIRSDIAHAFETIEDTRRNLVHVDPTLDELRAGELALRQDVTKLQGSVEERFDQLIDIQDEQRQETDARFDQLRHTLEERIERLNERLEETNDVFRETTYKLSEINTQIEDLRQTDASLHRDVWYLHEQRVRVRLEQVQEELDLATAQRRDAEGEARVGLGNRVRRRRGNEGA